MKINEITVQQIRDIKRIFIKDYRDDLNSAITEALLSGNKPVLCITISENHKEIMKDISCLCNNGFLLKNVVSVQEYEKLINHKLNKNTKILNPVDCVYTYNSDIDIWIVHSITNKSFRLDYDKTQKFLILFDDSNYIHFIGFDKSMGLKKNGPGEYHIYKDVRHEYNDRKGSSSTA